MALRDLLAKFKIKVDDSQIRNAEGKVNALRGAVERFENLEPVKLASKLSAIFGAIQLIQGKFIAASIAAAVFGDAVGDAIATVRQEADAVGKSAVRLGLTTDAFQELELLAEQGAVSVEQLGGAMGALAKNAQIFATTGKGEAAEAFKQMGINVREANGELKNAESLFFEVGGAIGDITGEQERSAAAQRVFGEAGRQLLTVFKGGTAAISRNRAAAASLGVVYRKDLVGAVERYNDVSGLLGRSTKILRVVALEPLIKVGAFLAEKVLLPMANRVAKLASGLDSVQRKMISFGGVVGAVSLAGRFILPVLGKILARFGVRGLTGALSKLIPLLARLALGFVKVVAPILLLEDAFTFLRGGDSIIGRLIDRLLGVGAARDAVEGLHAAFRLVADAVTILWDLLLGEELSSEVVDRFFRVTNNIAAFFDFLWRDIKQGAADVANSIADAITPDFLQGALGSIGGFLGSATSPVARLGSSAASNSNVQNSGNTVVNISADVGDPVAVGRAVTAAVPSARDNRAFIGLP